MTVYVPLDFVAIPLRWNHSLRDVSFENITTIVDISFSLAVEP